MKIRKVHCFFEQSGTFKNEFKKLGYNAFDYDIENRFNETDFQIDIFKSINNDLKDIDIKENDLVFCFFPCIYFSVQNYVVFQKLNKEQKMIRERKRIEYFYMFLKLICVLKKKNCSFIIENPYHASYLIKNLKVIDLPYIIDLDRTKFGDHYKKETIYFYHNINFTTNLFFNLEIPNTKTKKIVDQKHNIERSLMTPEYARNFIRYYIGENEND